ncbi:BofC C-terminal domain-containing protein [Paenibacillus sepulcri]|uniref:BofC C-terminal domain-containing protein n=1 Tax=Paenibacillus sepulcri TaxID=359917 RepID=A0ABS7CEB5_9BACL|nr:BofC C-terminal domain-containing protein [Paenibacillus sepulcri]
MMEFSLWKQLKKRIRRRRRSLWTLGSMLVLVSISALSEDVYAASLQDSSSSMNIAWVDVSRMLPEMHGESESSPAASSSVIKLLAEHQGQVKVWLHRTYICGEETSSLGTADARAVLGMLKQHPEWTAVIGENSSVVMEQRMDDLSEDCKSHAYIGMDKDGNLTLFDGPPKKEKVMRTFFQLDVNYMESSLPKERMDELLNGIRISDLDGYNSVLSTFSDYALDESEKVMKSTY